MSSSNVKAALDELDADKYDKTGGALSGQATSTAGDFNIVTNTALSNAAATLTAAQLIGGEFTITPSVARIQTLDTAANIISALSGSVTGSNFTFTIVNLAAFDVTVATAAGVTLVGNMVVNDGPAMFRVRRLSASTVSVTRIGLAGAGGRVGETITWNHSTPPLDCLEEDGSAISRTAYADLYAVIGVQFGAGDGSTTFNLDDKRGRALRGWAHGSANDPDRASRTNRGDGTAGDNVGTKQDGQIQSHTHSGILRFGSAGFTYDSSSGSSVSSAMTTNSTGGNETRMINTNVMFCIKF